MNKFKILRKDIASNKQYEKEKLFRIVKIDNSLIFDKDYSLAGKGIYILKDIDSLDLVLKKKLLKRYLNNDELILNLINELKEHLIKGGKL